MAHGQLSHAGLAPEVIWGTPIGAAKYLKIVSETLSLSIEELISTAQNARRDEPESLEGLGSVVGDIITEVHPEALGFFLDSFNGTPLSVDKTSSYLHTFTPEARFRTTDSIATAGAAAILTDSTQVWAVDSLIGRWIHIYAGTDAGDWQLITDNDGTTVTVGAFTVTPDNTSRYEIRTGPENCVLPPYTYEIHRDLRGATPAFQFSGCVPNTLGFSYGAGDKILKLTASMIGKSYAALSDTTPSMPSTEPFKWDQSVIAVGGTVTGTATAGTTATLTDTGNFTADAHIGDLVWIKTGTGINQVRKIASNTVDVLTFTTVMETAPALDDTYEIFTACNKIETLGWSLDNGLIPVPLINNTKRIARIEGDAYRTGTISPSLLIDDQTEWAYYTGWTTKKILIYFIGAAITAGHYYWTAFLFPKALFMTYPPAIAGPGLIRVGATMKAKYCSTAQYPFKIMLNNNTASY